MRRMLQLLEGILRYKNDNQPEIEKRHYCNYAMNTMRDETKNSSMECFIIHSTYEDRDIDGYNEALSFAELVNFLRPGEFILIDTGDYIAADDPDDETYDPYYVLYLVHKSDFDALAWRLDELDSEWRSEKMLVPGAIDLRGGEKDEAR